MRAFIAIDLPDAARAALFALQAGLKIGRLVPEENFHLTLAFLGDQQMPVLEDLHLALEQINPPAFELTFSGVDCFGGGKPRTLHAVAAPSPALKDLRHKIDGAIRDAGIERPREKFVPHVTLARFGLLSEEEMAELREGIARRVGAKLGPFPVESFSLVESRLRKNEPPIYEELAAYPLS